MGKLFFGNLANEKQAIAVIMAGGQGTRFWPLSRSVRPKQFLPLGIGGKSLLQETAERVEPLVGTRGILVVTNYLQRELVFEQLPAAAVLAEPSVKNTAPCIGFAALKILQTLGDVPMLCLPADHIIKSHENLLPVWREAILLAEEEDLLVTIGIEPTQPEIGYGYIHRGSSLQRIGGKQSESLHSRETHQIWCYKVREFVEKPNLERARQYLQSGNYSWNSGMFVWRPSVILAAIEKSLPVLNKNLYEIAKYFNAPDESERITEIFSSLEPVSIDVGVLEKAQNVALIIGKGFQWSDIGSWSSWAAFVGEFHSNNEQNITQGETVMVHSTNCAVLAKNKLIACVGLEDIVVVETEDAILVCKKDSAQDVKKVVEVLHKRNRPELL